MTDNKKHKKEAGHEPVGLYNVISVTFDPDENAYPALTKLKELDTQGQIELEDGAIVERSDNGDVVVKDHIGSVRYQGAAGGGLIGVLVGIIGGPLGVLIGGTYGLLVGSLVDITDVERSESVLSEISASVQTGRPALLAELTEQSIEVADIAMAQLGGTVLRRSVYDVEAEMAEAEEAQRKAKHEARKELMRARKDRNKERAHAKVEELKAKLPGREKAGSAS